MAEFERSPGADLTVPACVSLDEEYPPGFAFLAFKILVSYFLVVERYAVGRHLNAIYGLESGG